MTNPKGTLVKKQNNRPKQGWNPKQASMIDNITSIGEPGEYVVGDKRFPGQLLTNGKDSVLIQDRIGQRGIMDRTYRHIKDGQVKKELLTKNSPEVQRAISKPYKRLGNSTSPSTVAGTSVDNIRTFLGNLFRSINI